MGSILMNSSYFLFWTSTFWALCHLFIYSELIRPKENEQRRQWHSTPVLLPGKSHGWRSVVGYSPWGRKKLDMTERLHLS